jgi:hypothetical protein
MSSRSEESTPRLESRRCRRRETSGHASPSRVAVRAAPVVRAVLVTANPSAERFVVVVKTRPLLLVALAVVVPLAAAPATRAFADPLDGCERVAMDSPRVGVHPGFTLCPPVNPR